MVHVIYDVNTQGPFFQTGRGPGVLEEYPFYTGFRFQKGRGFSRKQYGRGILGNLLTRAWKYLVPVARTHLAPLVKEATRAVASEGLTAGQKILEELNKGADLGAAVQAQGTQAMKNLAKRAGKRLEQAGSGRKRKQKASKRSVTNLHLVGRSLLESAAKKKRLQNTGGTY